MKTTKKLKFALAMCVLLFDMRVKDLNNAIINTDDNEQIPVDYINCILNNVAHAVAIKEKIRMSVLAAVETEPKAFLNDNNEYHYNSNIYAHAYLVDSYIQKIYDDTRTKYVYRCTHCNSDNVQVKAWVDPNKGNKFIDYEVDDDQSGWCVDEQLIAEVQTVEIKKSARVIGFQVVGEKGTSEEGKMHPSMSNVYYLYNLEQAKNMLNNKNNREEQWQLLTIWSGDIEDPTIMFKGDPR